MKKIDAVKTLGLYGNVLFHFYEKSVCIKLDEGETYQKVTYIKYDDINGITFYGGSFAIFNIDCLLYSLDVPSTHIVYVQNIIEELTKRICE